MGKTTTARILAKALNCENGPTVTPCGGAARLPRDRRRSRSMDVIEIDGASNRGDRRHPRPAREHQVRARRSGRYKIYIIDEVHMLTEDAFNALLKTLEEPPAHAKFIFATTAAAQGARSTILSRCQRFDFRRATPAEIKDRLAWLAQKEKIKVSDAALMAIARRADGAIRDGEGSSTSWPRFVPKGSNSRT